jgi:hypothetical protein
MSGTRPVSTKTTAWSAVHPHKLDTSSASKRSRSNTPPGAMKGIQSVPGSRGKSCLLTLSRPRKAMETMGGSKTTVPSSDIVTFVPGGTATSTPSLGIRLLSDLRDVFGGAEALPTDQILKALCGLEESPWGEIDHGKPLNARGLSSRLRGYGVRSKAIRLGEKALKGYDRGDLADAWARYLSPSKEKSETSETPETAEKPEGDELERLYAEYGAWFDAMNRAPPWFWTRVGSPEVEAADAVEAAFQAKDVDALRSAVARCLAITTEPDHMAAYPDEPDPSWTTGAEEEEVPL